MLLINLCVKNIFNYKLLASLYYFAEIVVNMLFIILNLFKLFTGYFETMNLIYNLEPAEKPDYALLKKLLKQYKTEKLSSK